MAASADMTRAQALKLAIELCDAALERELEVSECTMIDCHATPEEIEAALGPDGFWRNMMQADRDQQVEVVVRWLAYGDERVH
jgi:hypothetical protein